MGVAARKAQQSSGDGGWLDRYFGLKQHGTSPGIEMTAGLTTFMTMAYILFVNPSILAAAGMDPQATMMATALSAGVATLIMGFYAKLPFALAPGMGINAFLTYSVVIGMGIPWQTALGAVFINGCIFLVISLLPIRERIIKDIPLNLKLATASAIGLFIAFIGLQGMGLVVASPATLVTLGTIASPKALVGLAGLVLTGVLLVRKVRGALLIGILGTTAISFFVSAPNFEGVVAPLATFPTSLSGVVALPDWATFSGNFGQLDIMGALSLGLLSVIFTFTFVDMFDTAGTFMGLATKLGWINKEGSFPGASKGLVSDAVGTIFGAVAGTSTVTTYIESAAGIGYGGRTGLTAVTTGALFLVAILFWPLALVIPGVATAPILVIVGFMMLEPVVKIDMQDYTEAIPAFLTLILMPLTYSIANGLIFGILSYVALKALSGRIRQVSLMMWVLAAFCVASIVWAAH